MPEGRGVHAEKLMTQLAARIFVAFALGLALAVPARKASAETSEPRSVFSILLRKHNPSILRQDAGDADFGGQIHQIALDHNIHPKLVEALISVESNFNPHAISPKGAIGLTQLMPGTARDLGVNPYNPSDNIRGGVRYLKSLLDEFDNLHLALAAYNAGPERVRQAKRIPEIPETKVFVRKVVTRYLATR
jgi:hypothetical protein